VAWINIELSNRFAEIAALLRLDGQDAFRVRAYERAAGAVAAATSDLGALDYDGLTRVRGIGDATARKILEYRETGEIGMLSELRARIPPALIDLVRVPGLGPKMARKLHDELGVDSLDALAVALDSGAVASLAGAGEKTAQNLRASLERLGAKDTDRIPAADVLAIAGELCERLGQADGVLEAVCAGSLRRMRETVGDLDVLVAADDAGAVMDAIEGGGGPVRRVLAAGEAKTSVIVHAAGPWGHRGLQVDLRVVEPAAWGAALIYFTGSAAHNVRLRERALRRGLSLNEYGVFRDGERVAGRTEAEVYEALGLAWIPAPMREDTGEVEAADVTKGSARLPRVVTTDDLRGDLHGHSDYSGDGKASLETMVAAAAARGWAYWAVTDHAENLSINGVSREDLLRRRDEIAVLSERYGIRVLDGLELNIDIDGGVDYDDEFLGTFDFCVASVHSLMQRGKSDQTRRICKAMEHPDVHVIGHPTGRKLGQRPGYDIDLDAVVAKAVETGTALEVNAHPRRLDLGADMVRRAVEMGAQLAISSDAHRVADLDYLDCGVATAQRGWLTPEQVLNCRDLDGLLAFVASKRAGAGRA
jgi:DNA polymerase (family X)